MLVHLIAVSGTGMGALAGLLRELGHRVSGSDVAFEPPIGPMLREWGVECREGFLAEHLTPRPDLVVVGNVCKRDNPEALAALEEGIEVTHIAGALRRLVLPGSVPLAVVGTHGKTTTSALLAWLLEHAGCAPGFFIGGVPENFGRGFRVPAAGAPCVLEGDEYDTAFFEKTPKFLHYGAMHAVLTSIEHDHVDIYPSEQSYLDAFEAFVALLPPTGVLVAHAMDPRVVDVVETSARCRVEWYRLAEPEAHAGNSSRPPRGGALRGQGGGLWLVKDLRADEFGQSFELMTPALEVIRCATALSGVHNALNSAAAVVAAHCAFGVSLGTLARGLPEFRGTRRRQQLLGSPQGIHVYDDFAHHPTAVRTTLCGLRARHPGGRLHAVFEPRSATACRRHHQNAYAAAFGAADCVLLAPVARAELPDSERLDTQELARVLRAQGLIAEACRSVQQIVEQLVVSAQPGDTIALLSNGSFGGIHGALLAALEERTP